MKGAEADQIFYQSIRKKKVVVKKKKKLNRTEGRKRECSFSKMSTKLVD